VATVVDVYRLYIHKSIFKNEIRNILIQINDDSVTPTEIENLIGDDLDSECSWYSMVFKPILRLSSFLLLFFSRAIAKRIEFNKTGQLFVCGEEYKKDLQHKHR
jgi:hypothetical protein